MSDRDEPMTQATCDGLTHVADQLLHVARLVHGTAADPSLTPAQWTALRYFNCANRFSRTPSAFSQFHATTRGTASQTVKSLITLRLLERHVNKADARSALIEVTAEGQRKLARDPLADLSTCIAALPADQRKVFAATLAKVSDALAKMRAAPTFGNCSDCGHCDTSDTSSAYCRCTHSILSEGEMESLCIDFASTVPQLR
jgi:DNA-binding MarR family transcriptional regulator